MALVVGVPAVPPTDRLTVTTQRCDKYQTYTPSQMRKVLTKAQIESLVKRGITTQLELHDILQDPNFGILPPT